MLNPANTHHDSLPSGHGAFLRRAAHDSQFRTALEADPQAALAEYGLSVDLDQVPSQVTIPSAENILDILIDEGSDSEDASRTDRAWMPFVSV